MDGDLLLVGSIALSPLGSRHYFIDNMSMHVG